VKGVDNAKKGGLAGRAAERSGSRKKVTFSRQKENGAESTKKPVSVSEPPQVKHGRASIARRQKSSRTYHKGGDNLLGKGGKVIWQEDRRV